ncbi:hypothetical protein [Candidatus Enterococcus mansonii]|uniref:Uncharacterized protein n=1 Tax=Candidatus Enterococcus mansonii TaxID=1834181 RepID=A0A242CIS8_9ENTE|nr:hypothetical protein [Enterococcus sp. 4G2_DIV0659]OTO10136.1 hypothetical protein A5880_000819 [Enterococcus sp. 4G2_DIV0659]
MKELTIGTFSIKYDNMETKECSVKVNDYLYIENKPLPSYLIGTATLTFFEFYQADCPNLKESDYLLTERFQQIIGRFPHTNHQKIVLTDKTSYCIKGVPIYLTAKDYILAFSQLELYPETYKKVKAIESSLTPVINEQVSVLGDHKRKRLFLDGTYGSREWLGSGYEKNVQMIQNKLEYVNELYSFAHYSYAGMIQFLPECGIETYDQFHEAYGKYVYSLTITKNGENIPLLWPDYLYHRPENHIEFGLLANTNQIRYQSFKQWKAGEQVTIEVLADGFEDVRFETCLKQQMSLPPRLSKSVYNQGERICLSIDSEIVKEVEQQTATVELIPSKKTVSGYSLNYTFSKDQLIIASEQFEQLGRYQLKITSDNYGQLLFLFTIKQEGSVQ